MTQNSLTELAKHTTIVADTGDLSAIARLRPQDATTNPSLITAALLSGDHDDLIDQVKGQDIDVAIDHLTVALGEKISELVEGRVSTEVDARLSFDTQGTVDKALEFIKLYEELGIDKSKILIKIAATWEGVKAAEILEKQGIACNLTLLFTKAQARACADANVTLISPFVGRITDFQKAQEGVNDVAIENDMGVNSVKSIYEFYKKHGYRTEVMGASFRNIHQLIALAGCDLLTISPALLDELANSSLLVPKVLDYQGDILPKPAPLTEAEFRTIQDNEPLNALLIKGIDGFIQARETLANHLSQA
ncbi:transaldolase [Moraxella bovoculi]|uniref:transaldolase n=1 Tax=Moraxella bovoculi TaxID=386891 RepID=UPI00062486AE|nr:transaldolase [Moraxella bovoculi]AKG18727.1 transaldolase [Moraxella bovoculi]NSM10078.1 transaldolase [Moraxella bovoculi]